MTVIGDARVELAGKLTAAGLPVTLDPAALPPCVLVDAVRGRSSTAGIGAWPAAVYVRPIVPPPGDAAALELLEQYVETILTTLGRPAGDEWNPGTYPNAGKDCPAYALLYPLEIPNPNC